LTSRVHTFDAGSPATRASIRLALTRWRIEPDLAGLREPGEMDRLPADERKEWLALWAELAAVLTRPQ
jgi:serine/threonine-protein kinase